MVSDPIIATERGTASRDGCGSAAVELDLPHRGAALGPVKVAIRPESLRLSTAPPAGPALEGRIAKAAYLGTHMEYTVSTPVGELFVVDRDGHAPRARGDTGVGGLRGPRRHRRALTGVRP